MVSSSTTTTHVAVTKARLWPFLALIVTILYIISLQSHNQAYAAPIPPRLARQPPNMFNNTYFPYTNYVPGPMPPPVHQPGSVLDTCLERQTYAISFDDSPGQLTDELLDFLDEQNLKVTFFVNGDNWNCVYGSESKRLLRRAYAAQHQIASHPWSHQDLESLSDDAIRQEMYKIEQALRLILGVVPRYMRPPFGEHSPRVRRVLQELGYVLVLWDVDQLYSSMASSGNSGPESVSSSEQMPLDFVHHHDGASAETWLGSSRAEAVRGVPPIEPLDRDSMSLSGIFQEATGIWALEYVESVGYAIQPVGTCLGESDPRHWYKEIGPPAPDEMIPTACS